MSYEMESAERFWAKVGKTDGCWEWAGALIKSRAKQPLFYGSLRCGKATKYAHRISWEMHNGPIPDGMFVLHRCDNPRCVRPEHLYVGTLSDNMRDRAARGRANLSRGDAHHMRRGMAKSGAEHARATLTEAQAAEIRAKHTGSRGDHTRLAVEYRTNRHTIAKVVAGRSY